MATEPISRRFVLFEVGRANVGDAGKRQRVSELLAEWNAALVGSGVRLTGSVGHTGNYIAEAEGGMTAADIAVRFRELGVRVAVFGAGEFLAWVALTRTAFTQNPETPPGRRPTPGVVMNLDSSGRVPPLLPSSERMLSAPIAGPRVRGVWKLDVLREDGKALDRTKREGGWGAVAEAIRRQRDGEWTARSMRTINRLAARLVGRGVGSELP